MFRRGAVVSQFHDEHHRAIAVVPVEVGLDEEVADVDLGRTPERHVPKDPRESPHVLVLEVAAHAEAVDLDGQQVFTRSYIPGDIELGGIPAVDAVAHLLAVDPEVKGRVDTVERDEGPASLPPGRNLESAAIAADRVALLVRSPVLRRVGHHPRPVLLEDVADVAVIGRAVAEELPARRNRNVVPFRDVELGFGEVDGPLVGVGHVVELPGAVETPCKRRISAAGGQRLLQRGVGHERRVRRLLVDAQAAGILQLRREAGMRGAACQAIRSPANMLRQHAYLIGQDPPVQTRPATSDARPRREPRRSIR